jgi:hypothetical protein
VFSFSKRFAVAPLAKEKTEGTMQKQLIFVLILTLAVGTLAATSAAQNLQAPERQNARVEYVISNPGQSDLLMQTAWDDHRRCDGDHDRDDRGCWNGDRDGDRYYRGNGYYGNQYYGNNPYRQNNGWYDRKGNFYPSGANGYFDKHSKWHYFRGGRDHD